MNSIIEALNIRNLMTPLGLSLHSQYGISAGYNIYALQFNLRRQLILGIGLPLSSTIQREYK
jgi:hypothetical protein